MNRLRSPFFYGAPYNMRHDGDKSAELRQVSVSGRDFVSWVGQFEDMFDHGFGRWGGRSAYGIYVHVPTTTAWPDLLGLIYAYP